MSPLHDALSDYLATRRALGTELREPGMTLRGFVDFLEQRGATTVTSALALEWAVQRVGVQHATWARRLSMVRRFAAWLSATDPRTEIPQRGLLPAKHRRKSPHVFSDEEIVLLMASASRLHSPGGLRAPTFRALIGLMVSTGLRPGEAMALDVADVDLSAGVISVRRSKFGKSRFVPLHESTRVALARYAVARDAAVRPLSSTAFFVSERGARLVSVTARRTWALLCSAVGLRPSLGARRLGRGPRLHDLRHAFATRRIIEWYAAGADVGRLMPSLSTYLGHSQVHNTYWYIEAVPELLQRATDRLVTQARGGGQ